MREMGAAPVKEAMKMVERNEGIPPVRQQMAVGTVPKQARPRETNETPVRNKAETTMKTTEGQENATPPPAEMAMILAAQIHAMSPERAIEMKTAGRTKEKSSGMVPIAPIGIETARPGPRSNPHGEVKIRVLPKRMRVAIGTDHPTKKAKRGMGYGPEKRPFVPIPMRYVRQTRILTMDDVSCAPETHRKCRVQTQVRRIDFNRHSEVS
jgi:hypothetical protein